MRASFTASGSFTRTENFLKQLTDTRKITSILERYGQEGVNALSTATPVETGESATSWSYTVTVQNGSYSIAWTNSHMAGGTPVVILLQYGHGTGTGGYVQGRDFINPVMQPIFDRIANDVSKAVISA